MRSKPRGWVARNVLDGLVVLAVLVSSLWVIPRGIGGRGGPVRPPAAAATTLPPPPTSPPTSAPTAVSTSTSHPQRSAVVGSVRLKGFAQGLAFGPGSVWRIDPASNKVVAKISLGESLAGFIGVAATDTAVWVSSGEQQDGQRGGILMRIDPRRNRVTARVPLPTVPSDVAATRDSVWIAMTNGQVLEIDAARGHPIGAVDTGGPLGFTQTIALGAGSVWLADPLAGLVLRVDPTNLRVVARIATGAITALAFGSGGVWAVGKPGILRIDPVTSRVTAMLPAAQVEGVLMVATGAGWVWAGSAELVARLDPRLIRS